jgi:hypothetical protein
MDEVWTAYRDMMITKQAEHPSTLLVWWTWPIIASDHSRAYCNEELEGFNDTVRAYVDAHGGVLFDIADIESHDPDGNPVDYNGWEAAYPAYTTDGAHLSEMGRQRAANALWSLLARTAGWGDTTEWISITAIVDAATIFPGEAETYTLSLTASQGYTATVAFDLHGAPSAAAFSFQPRVLIPPATSQLHVTTTASAVADSYHMTVTASSGDLVGHTPLTLTILSASWFGLYLPIVLK